MVDFVVLFQFLQTVSIIVGIAYYIMILQNQEKTRKTQIFLQLYNQLSFKERQRDWLDVMNFEWNDYDDFEKKYGSDNNPEAFAQRMSLFYYFEGIGAMLNDGWIDLDKVTKLLSNYPIWIWTKFKPIIAEWRDRYGLPNGFMYFEYLAEELETNVKITYPDYKVPETFARYIPDQ